MTQTLNWLEKVSRSWRVSEFFFVHTLSSGNLCNSEWICCISGCLIMLDAGKSEGKPVTSALRPATILSYLLQSSTKRS